MKEALFIGLLVMGLFVSGCTEPQVSSEEPTQDIQPSGTSEDVAVSTEERISISEIDDGCVYRLSANTLYSIDVNMDGTMNSIEKHVADGEAFLQIDNAKYVVSNVFIPILDKDSYLVVKNNGWRLLSCVAGIGYVYKGMEDSIVLEASFDADTIEEETLTCNHVDFVCRENLYGLKNVVQSYSIDSEFVMTRDEWITVVDANRQKVLCNIGYCDIDGKEGVLNAGEVITISKYNETQVVFVDSNDNLGIIDHEKREVSEIDKAYSYEYYIDDIEGKAVLEYEEVTFDSNGDLLPLIDGTEKYNMDELSVKATEPEVLSEDGGYVYKLKSNTNYLIDICGDDQKEEVCIDYYTDGMYGFSFRINNRVYTQMSTFSHKYGEDAYVMVKANKVSALSLFKGGRLINFYTKEKTLCFLDGFYADEVVESSVSCDYLELNCRVDAIGAKYAVKRYKIDNCFKYTRDEWIDITDAIPQKALIDVVCKNESETEQFILKAGEEITVIKKQTGKVMFVDKNGKVGIIIYRYLEENPVTGEAAADYFIDDNYAKNVFDNYNCGFNADGTPEGYDVSEDVYASWGGINDEYDY